VNVGTSRLSQKMSCDSRDMMFDLGSHGTTTTSTRQKVPRFGVGKVLYALFYLAYLARPTINEYDSDSAAPLALDTNWSRAGRVVFPKDYEAAHVHRGCVEAVRGRERCR
jgi:hypothetical protein